MSTVIVLNYLCSLGKIKIELNVHTYILITLNTNIDLKRTSLCNVFAQTVLLHSKNIRTILLFGKIKTFTILITIILKKS